MNNDMAVWKCRFYWEWVSLRIYSVWRCVVRRSWGRAVQPDFGGSCLQCVLCMHMHTCTWVHTYIYLMAGSFDCCSFLLQEADKLPWLRRFVHLRRNTFKNMEKIGVPASLIQMRVILGCVILSPCWLWLPAGQGFFVFFFFLNVKHQERFHHSWCSVVQ